MWWVLIGLAVIAVIVVVSRTRQKQVEQQRRETAARELAGVKHSADEDVTQFGEELQRLDSDIAGRDLDEGTRADYQRALDGYEAAKDSVAAVTAPDELRHVAEILEDGRYAVACVRARVVGEQLPTRRPPCFFNPQHGPSVRDVPWAPERGASRDVPACELDAQRVEQGAEPDSRKVMVGSQRVPYWQAGPAYAPMTAGYFGAGLMPALFLGTMMGMSFGGFDGSYDQGYEDGQDSGSDGGSDGGSDSGAGGDSSGDAGGGWDGGGGFDGGGGGWGGGGFDGGGFDGGSI